MAGFIMSLKPQDSFGGFDKKKNLDLQKVHQTRRKHHY